MKRIIFSNYLVWLFYQWIIVPVLLSILGVFIIVTAMLEAMRKELVWMKKLCTEAELSIKYSVYKRDKKNVLRRN
jgi:uncharacterized membrane protein